MRDFIVKTKEMLEARVDQITQYNDKIQQLKESVQIEKEAINIIKDHVAQE